PKPEQNQAPSNNTKDAKQTVTRDQPLKTKANKPPASHPLQSNHVKQQCDPARRPKSAAQCVRDNFIARDSQYAGNLHVKQIGPAYQGCRDLPASVSGATSAARRRNAPFRRSGQAP
ncbi:MAG: hypothetical protein P1U65_04480, partial [Minwuia sp.]|nr:hypothetical protein [Minwuia sp.]